MMRLVRFLDGRFFAPVPAERLATVRVLTGAFAVIYLITRANVLGDFRVQPGGFQPVGLASVLSAPLPAAVELLFFGLCVMAGVLFTLGRFYRVSGPLFALLLLWVTSYRNSWGMIFHTDNLLVLHVIVLALCDAAAGLSLDARGHAPAPDAGRFGWPLRLMMLLTAVSYLLAGIAKLKLEGWLGPTARCCAIKSPTTRCARVRSARCIRRLPRSWCSSAGRSPRCLGSPC